MPDVVGLTEFLAGARIDPAVFALRPDYRALLLAETLEWPERQSFLRGLQARLLEPESRSELAKSLESRGFHREAIPVYREDATKRDRDYAPLQGLFEAAAAASSFCWATSTKSSYWVAEVE